MKIEVRSEKFELSHGRKPRGTGCWAFGTLDESKIWWIYGSYTEAKRKAIVNAKAELHCCTEIYVLP